MLWVGLTGGIGSGKSSVSGALRQRGFPVIDADQIAHQLVQPGQPALKEIVREFGPEVLKPDGQLDRAKLGQMVFAAEPLKLKLESILHPRVQREVERARQKLAENGEQMAFYDVPLLFEKGLSGFDLTVLVWCRPEQQQQRVKQRDGLSDQQIANRIASQMNINEKKRLADLVVDNSGAPETLQGQVSQLLADIEDFRQNK